MKKIIIIGAGDGGRIISQIIKENGNFDIIGFIDNDKNLQGRSVNGYKVVGGSLDLHKFKKSGFVVSIGTNMKARAALFKKAINAMLEPVNIIHKSAIIDKSASIGKGAVILANCVIGPFAKIGLNSFIFTGTIIEHDCVCGDNLYFSPGVKLAGHVKAGDNTFFGIDSCVIENINIGNNVIVGAGSVVLKNVPDNTVVAGVPARRLRRNR